MKSVKKSPIKPMAKRIVALKQQPKTQTESGILLGKSEEKPIAAEVIAIGEKVKYIEVGQQILYKEYSATDIKINNETYLIIEEEDILGILEDN